MLVALARGAWGTFDTQRLDRLARTAVCSSCQGVQQPQLYLGWTWRVVRSLAERSDGFGFSRGGSEPSAGL